MIELANKRILITGGNGYLGKLLVQELLGHTADVFVLDQCSSNYAKEYIVDITNYSEVENVIRECNPHIVFHLAANLNRTRDFSLLDSSYEVNVKGTKNLLDALVNSDCNRFVFTSTSEIYGNNPTPFKESMLPKPTSPYSVTKVYAEMLIKTYQELYSFQYTILRLFNFYGPDMPSQFFIPQMLNALKNNKPFEMTKGEQTRDFLHVDDVIHALVSSSISESTINDTFNVCSGKATTLRDFALECKHTLGSTSEIAFGSIPYRENEIWDMTGDNTMLKERTGFNPENNIASLIKKVIAS